MHNESHLTKPTSTRIEFLAGLGSGILTIGLTYPITKLIYRQILDNENSRNSLTTIKREGWKILYRGSMAPMIQRCIALSMMFGFYRACTVPLEPLKLNEYVEKVSASTLAGFIESFFMPLERLQILLIHSKYHSKFHNMFHAVKLVTTEYNLKEFYRGYLIVLVRNIAANTCYFVSKEEINKRLELSDIAFRRNLQHFLYGSLLGTTMTVLFYPLKVVKINIHKTLGGKFVSPAEAVMEVYGQNGGGVRNFYRGIGVNGVRAVFSWGVTNSTYEYFKRVLV